MTWSTASPEAPAHGPPRRAEAGRWLTDARYWAEIVDKRQLLIQKPEEKEVLGKVP